MQQLIKDYKKELNRLTFIFLVLQFLIYPVKYASVVMVLWMLWLFGVIIFIYVPYIRANKKLRELKREYQLEKGESQQNYTYVDVTTAMEEKPKYFQKATRIAGVLGFLPAIGAAVLEGKIHSSGAPELWIMELSLLSIAVVGAVCVWALHYYNRQPAIAYTMDSSVNSQLSRVKKYQWSRCFCFLAWMSVIVSAVMWAGFYLGGEYMVSLILISCILYGIIPMVMIAVCGNVVRKQSAKLLKGSELLVGEEDENWIWGLFYCNKKDKRFIVDNRMGTGTSINMAHRAAVVFNGVMMALVLLTVIGTGAILGLDEFTPLKLSYEGEQLVAEQWKEEYRIPKEDIISVTLLEELPHMSKSSGTGMENVYKGKWFSREYNRRFCVCLNPQETPVLMVETKDGEWYLLGDGEAERTEEIYQELVGNK